MSYKSEKSTTGYLRDMYQKFMLSYREGKGAWGQFLDSRPDHPQVGRYGTSAGAIVLALSNHKNDTTANKVIQTLSHWAEDSLDDQNVNHSCHNLPILLMLIG